MEIKIKNIIKVSSLYHYDSEITEILNPFCSNFVIIESHVVGIGNDTYEYSVWTYDVLEINDKYNYEVVELNKLITEWR